jgi:hypothetical protein
MTRNEPSQMPSDDSYVPPVGNFMIAKMPGTFSYRIEILNHENFVILTVFIVHLK